MGRHSSSSEPHSTFRSSNYQGRHRAEDGGRHETRDAENKLTGWSAGREPKAPDNYNR